MIVHRQSQPNAHHESGDVCLCGVRGQVDLLGGTALVFGIHDHAVASEAFQTSQSVLLTGSIPAHSEGGGADLGELEVVGGRDGCKK